MSKYKMKPKCAININSVFSLFPQIKLKILPQIIEFFLCREYNTDKAFETMKQSFIIQISKVTIYKISKEFRNTYSISI